MTADPANVDLLAPPETSTQARSEGAHHSSERIDPIDDRPAVGSWWWVSERVAPVDVEADDDEDELSGSDDEDREDDDEPSDEADDGETSEAGESIHDRDTRDRSDKWLACVVELGSNYVKVKGVRLHRRISIDEFHDLCAPEPAPQVFIDAQISQRRDRVRALMGEIRDLCHRLGVPMRQAIAAHEASSTALAVAHGVDNVKAYKNSLVLAKEETLPELFKKVREQHEQMAIWMKAELIPAEAELSAATEVTRAIEGKIHTVELYAGLQEELVQVREGDPAGLDARVHLMQRMHFMDEECLAKYEAGGMDFEDIGAFDAWLARDGNFGRIFPRERCVVAFRIRRNRKEYKGLDAFIKFGRNMNNQRTFLYIRNGEQLWRMSTSIEFSEGLFPRREDEAMLGDQELWIKSDEWDLAHGSGLITRRARDAMIDDHRARRDHMAQRLWQWHRAGKPAKRWLYTVVASDRLDHDWAIGAQLAQDGRPHRGFWLERCDADDYQQLTPDHLYYDDAMKRIRAATLEHNRIAVIVQGLLDRSVCLHPHPPWRIWTPEGFAAGIELVYDVSRALTPGEAPDFEAYRAQLNRSLKVGCHTIGQRGAWMDHMAELYGDKSWRYEGRHGKGPDKIHLVRRMKRDRSCEFAWTRRQQKAKWVPDPQNRGYLKATYPERDAKWLCPADRLTCVDAYTPGDFHLFFDDPRTRADYLEWAPILLACEDWHRARREASSAIRSPGDADADDDSDEKSDGDESIDSDDEDDAQGGECDES